MCQTNINNFKEYIYKHQVIEDIDTYIILPEHYGNVQKILNLGQKVGEMILRTVKHVKKAELYPAIIYNPHFPNPWFHMLCYRNGENFYHIHFHDGWMCRECGYNNGAVIMPMSESDAIYYAGTEKHYPSAPPIFKKIPCKNCGKMLQNHLIRV